LEFVDPDFVADGVQVEAIAIVKPILQVFILIDQSMPRITEFKAILRFAEVVQCLIQLEDPGIGNLCENGFIDRKYGVDQNPGILGWETGHLGDIVDDFGWGPLNGEVRGGPGGWNQGLDWI
jgi:hypothetical protein